MGMLHKVEEAWRKKLSFMMCRNVIGICILQVILLCAWVTVMDMLVGILMGLMVFMEGMV